MKPRDRFLLFVLSLSLNLPLAAQTDYEKPVQIDPFGSEPAGIPVETPEAVPVKGTVETPAVAKVNLSGQVLEEGSGRLLESIVLEIFVINEQGQHQRAFTGMASSGRFTLPLLEGLDHMMIIRKVGYEPRSVLIEAAFEDLEAVYYLSGRSEQATVEPVALRSEVVEPQTQSLPARASAPPADEDPVFESYQLTQETSLRYQPTAQSGVILRFAPGDRVLVLEKTGKQWWKVRHQGEVGYVKSALLTP